MTFSLPFRQAAIADGLCSSNGGVDARQHSMSYGSGMIGGVQVDGEKIQGHTECVVSIAFARILLLLVREIYFLSLM